MTAHDTSLATIRGSAAGNALVERIAAGCSDPDAMLRTITAAMAADGFLVPPGPTLRGACRAIQKSLEATHAVA